MEYCPHFTCSACFDDCKFSIYLDCVKCPHYTGCSGCTNVDSEYCREVFGDGVEISFDLLSLIRDNDYTKYLQILDDLESQFSAIGNADALAFVQALKAAEKDCTQ